MQTIKASVPLFTMTPNQLMAVMDEISHHAARALELGSTVMALGDAESRAQLAGLLERVKHIGFMADASVADCSVNLQEVWGVAPANREP